MNNITEFGYLKLIIDKPMVPFAISKQTQKYLYNIQLLYLQSASFKCLSMTVYKYYIIILHMSDSLNRNTIYFLYRMCNIFFRVLFLIFFLDNN